MIRILARSFAHNMLKGLVLIAFLVMANALTTSTRVAGPEGYIECWNPHTAQITVEVDGVCDAPVNPYK